MIKMIIVAGKTIQEVKDKLNQIEELAAAGYQCGIGGDSLAEIREMANRLDLPIQYAPTEEEEFLDILHQMFRGV